MQTPAFLRLIANIPGYVGRLAARGWSRAAFFSLIALLIAWPILGRAGLLNEFRDAHVLYSYEYAAVTAVRDFLQLPLWNPYYCGGMYGLGSPQSRYASPAFLLSLLFGADRAQPVIAFLMLILGMEGFFRFARTRTASSLGPALAAPLFAGNGFLAAAYFMGWINFLGFLLLPWVLLGVDRAARAGLAGVAVTAVAFAFIIGFGGTYTAPIAAIFAILEAGRVLVRRRRNASELARALFFLAAAAYFSLCLSAFRLWPIGETLFFAPRIMAGNPAHGFGELSNMLLAKSAPRAGNFGYSGYFYLGIAPLLLAAAGVFSRRGLVVAAFAALGLWIATGYHFATGPFVWLRELPVLSTLRYPERFLFVAAFYLAALAALGVDRLALAARKYPLMKAALLGALAISALGYADQIRNFHATILAMNLGPPPPRVNQEFRQARGNRWALAYYAPMSRGSLSCWEAYPVSMSSLLRGDLPREEYLAEPGKGEVSRTFWSPNRIRVRVDTAAPARLLVNQNWHQGWRSSAGKVVSHQGLLAVDLPAGKRDVTLSFLPRSAAGGALVSLAAILGLAWSWRLLKRPRSVDARFAASASAAAGLPLLAAAAALVAIREPAPPWPVIRNANGEPAVIDSLPPGARPLEVWFEEPVRLRGVRLPGSADRQGIASFDLFWSVHGSVPRSVGIFVQLQGPNGRVIAANHEVLAASWFFFQAPRGRLIRDAFSAQLGLRPAGLWRAYAGLWRASGDGSRVAVVNAGGLPVAENRVYVGSFTIK